MDIAERRRADRVATALPVTATLEDLWADFKRTGSREARGCLIVRYSPLVAIVAAKVAAGMPRNVERADLVSYGVFGLIDAIDRFDLSREVKFETYAVVRIRGSIIDELRMIDWVPRSVRAKARSVERANAKLEAVLLRAPTDADVAAELGITEDELQRIFTEISLVGMIPLDDLLSSGRRERGEPTTVLDMIPDQGEGPVAAFEVREMSHLLTIAINHLVGREMAVVNLYYYQGLTLEQIGEMFGVTASRICQIRGKAITQLRSQLREPALAAA